MIYQVLLNDFILKKQHPTTTGQLVTLWGEPGPRSLLTE